MFLKATKGNRELTEEAVLQYSRPVSIETFVWACLTFPPQWPASPHLHPTYHQTFANRGLFVRNHFYFWSASIQGSPFLSLRTVRWNSKKPRGKDSSKGLTYISIKALPKLHLPAGIIHTAFIPLTLKDSFRAPELHWWGREVRSDRVTWGLITNPLHLFQATLWAKGECVLSLFITLSVSKLWTH